MSANIYWNPVNPIPRHGVNTMAPSSFLGILRNRFGEPPFTMDEEDRDWLQGVMDTGNVEGFEDLLTAIEEHKMIEITVEY